MFVVHVICWVLFFVAAIMLSVVILLQEGKGGGLAEAFGGIGAETFGVKSGGINKFTFTLAGIFVASAILLHATW
jgi:preprotein translocase subunit SecG